MGNLQLLCQTCHFRKTEKNMIQLSATDDKYAERKMKYIKLMLRIMAEKPVRECDDDIAWNHRPLVNERQQAMQNARILGMLNQAINNPALQ